MRAKETELLQDKRSKFDNSAMFNVWLRLKPITSGLLTHVRTNCTNASEGRLGHGCCIISTVPRDDLDYLCAIFSPVHHSFLKSLREGGDKSHL